MSTPLTPEPWIQSDRAHPRCSIYTCRGPRCSCGGLETYICQKWQLYYVDLGTLGTVFIFDISTPLTPEPWIQSDRAHSRCSIYTCRGPRCSCGGLETYICQEWQLYYVDISLGIWRWFRHVGTSYSSTRIQNISRVSEVLDIVVRTDGM